MQALETQYKGFRFRSRTEARWGVFFDAIGIDYLYEHEDVKLSTGRYLPDFFLPYFDDGGAYVEVKGVFQDYEVEKCKELCALTGKMVLMLAGVPDFKCYKYFQKHFEFDIDACTAKGCKKEMVYDWLACSLSPDECCAPKVESIKEHHGIISAANKYGERMYVYPGFEKDDLSFSPEDWYDNYAKAINAARSARFEHGQSGATI